MVSMLPLAQFRLRFGLFVLNALALLCVPTMAQPAQSAEVGGIRGHVMNASSGNYLNNVKVYVQGTAIETLTDETGRYRLREVPAGEIVLVTHFVGMETQAVKLTVPAGATVEQDFSLRLAASDTGDNVVTLEEFTVKERAMTGQAIALTEQKIAVNIKNVISTDEFVDMGEANLGEFMKYIPGVDIEYNPFNPSSVGIRGMPASGTVVQYDGVTTAATSGSNTRSFDLNTTANANIDRIEISKVPTPDMPANAVGGSVNVISKSGFSRPSPLFTYNLYTTYSARRGEFDPIVSKIAGPDKKSTLAPVQMAYNLTYILPIKQKFGFTFALGHSPRYQEAEFLAPSWDLAALLTGTQNVTVGSQYMGEYISYVSTDIAKATFDWRISSDSALQVSYHLTDRESAVRQNRARWVTSATGRSGDRDFTEGRGAPQQNVTGNSQYRKLDVLSATYRYNGQDWKMDASVSYSNGSFDFKDTDDGFFSSATTQAPTILVGAYGHSGINDGRVPDLVTTTTGGQPFDFADGTLYSVNATGIQSNQRRYENEVMSAGVNLSREFQARIPTRIKVGAYVEQMRRDTVGGLRTWTFAPPGGSAGRRVSNYDLIAEEYSERSFFTTVSGQQISPRYLSLSKLYDLYVQNPSWFSEDAVNNYINYVNSSVEIDETITAFYFRMDNKLIDNRLNITSGVRYERTTDDGRGPLNDSSLAAGNPNPLEAAKLQYTERGFTQKSHYGEFYPSINIGYNLGKHFVVRAAYARTIGRPDLDEIIPSITIRTTNSVEDPDLGDARGVVEVVDGNLNPWTANNYDLTFEAYDYKGATASVSLFSKDIQDFFLVQYSEMTAERLTELGLAPDLLDYRERRLVNAGSSRVSGLELSYRQRLNFIPRFGRQIELFGNYTKSQITGPNAEDFTRVPNMMLNGGLSFVTRKFEVKLNVSYRDWIRLARASNPAGSPPERRIYTMLAPSTRVDLSMQYRLNRWLTFYCSARNVLAEPERRSVVDVTYGTPDYAKPRDYRFLATAYTFGIKGSF